MINFLDRSIFLIILALIPAFAVAAWSIDCNSPEDERIMNFACD